MDTPANTWTYFIAGYTVILTSLVVYIFSLAVRWKKLRDKLRKIRNSRRGNPLVVEKVEH